jgi:alkylhydroperoxidase family enzyme
MGTLVSKVAEQPTNVTDEDFAAARASGLSEDQIFEMVVSAAIGQATRQYNTALAALDAATEEE